MERFNETLRELSEEEWTEEIKVQERRFLTVQWIPELSASKTTTTSGTSSNQSGTSRQKLLEWSLDRKREKYFWWTYRNSSKNKQYALAMP